MAQVPRSPLGRVRIQMNNSDTDTDIEKRVSDLEKELDNLKKFVYIMRQYVYMPG